MGDIVGLRRVILALLALAVGGCVSVVPRRGGPHEPAMPAGGLTEAEELRAELAMVKKRVEELRLRNGRLAEEVTKLKFLNEQLHKQLQAVGDAPRKRDLYRKQLARQLVEIQSLQARVAELEARSPASSPTPTTQPKQGGR